jgi:TAG lipase/steryl ester hydrolase/phospholipase A2/LPA acyltransferase
MRATKLGEKHVWEKLAAIEANCAVEATLDACLARLTNRAREAPPPPAGLSARVPSWMSMPTSAHQTAVVTASWGNPLQASASAMWGPGGWRQASGGALDAYGSSYGSAGAGGGGGGVSAAAQLGTTPPLHAGAGFLQQPLPPQHAHPLAHSDSNPMLLAGHTTASHAEAMAAAAAAAMVGQARVSYFHPVGSVGADLLTAAHFPQGIHTIHEAMGEERVPRVPSWGSSVLLADSASDYPRTADGGSSSADATPRSSMDGSPAVAAAVHRAGYAGYPTVASVTGAGPSGHHHSSRPAHYNNAAGGGGGSSGSGSAGGGGSTTASTSVDGTSRGRARHGGGAPASAGSSPSHHRHNNDADDHFISSPDCHAPARASDPASHVSQLDCCDMTASFDIWGGLLALGSATVALEAAAEGESLDCIAP